jgi:hypothetical protein
MAYLKWRGLHAAQVTELAGEASALLASPGRPDDRQTRQTAIRLRAEPDVVTEHPVPAFDDPFFFPTDGIVAAQWGRI